MAPAERTRPVVLCEHTPNPNCVKLVVHGLPDSDRDCEVEDPAVAAALSPLAARLFAAGDVCRVYVRAPFASVTRSPGADWTDLGPRLVEALRKHVESGEPWVHPRPEATPPSESASSGIEARIRELLDREIRPAVQRDGGDVSLVSFEAGVVHVDLRGACVGCPSATATLHEAIERRLRGALPEVTSVVADSVAHDRIPLEP